MTNMTTSSSISSLEMPGPALVGFAASLIFYLLSLLEPLRPPVLLTGIVLVCGAAVHLTYGIYSRQRGNGRIAAILLPFGMFWLSLVGYDVFPSLGLGRHPGAITMFSYMSLWGLFAAILFLGSFRKSVAVQIFYGALMGSLLSLSVHHLRDDRVFLVLACFSGTISSLTALYIAIIQSVNRRLRGNSASLAQGGCIIEEGRD